MDPEDDDESGISETRKKIVQTKSGKPKDFSKSFCNKYMFYNPI